MGTEATVPATIDLYRVAQDAVEAKLLANQAIRAMDNVIHRARQEIGNHILSASTNFHKEVDAYRNQSEKQHPVMLEVEGKVDALHGRIDVARTAVSELQKQVDDIVNGTVVESKMSKEVSKEVTRRVVLSLEKKFKAEMGDNFVAVRESMLDTLNSNLADLKAEMSRITLSLKEHLEKKARRQRGPKPRQKKGGRK